MDILQLLGAGPLKATTQENRLRGLVEEAGKRNENWKQIEHGAGRERYECPMTEKYHEILAEARPYARIVNEWLKNRNLIVDDVEVPPPMLLKKGTLVTSDGAVAIVIPLPFMPCEVQYQPNKDDNTTGEGVEWLQPVFLPENGALALMSGWIKCIMMVICVKKSPDHDSHGDGKGLTEE